MKNHASYNTKKEKSNAITLGYLISVALRKWYWFAISAILCLGLAFWYISSATKIYKAEAMILIKDDSQKGGSISEASIFADMGIGTGGAVVENEIYVLRSLPLMISVVNKLNLDVSYVVEPLLRNVDIYKRSPVNVDFLDKEQTGSLSVEITPASGSSFTYSITDKKLENRSGTANLFDTISTSKGRFVVKPTLFWSSDYSDGTVTVTLEKIENVAEGFLKNLSVSRPDKVTSILEISLTDNNFTRAKDVVNMLIAVYNEDAIRDKNQIANNTEKFIVERIATISEDLGGIDGQIEQIKKENQIIDFTTSAEILVQTGSKYKEEVIALETQIALANFIKDYLLEPANKEQLIPTNLGISDSGIESQIISYNEQMLNLNRMAANAGANNPVVIELRNTLSSMRSNMMVSIDNLLASLNIQRNQALQQENIANRRIESVPGREKEVNDILREQKIKEQLYLYLLNKREENALNLAITESNAKIIESANGENIPIAPKSLNVFALALIIGLIIPVLIIIAKFQVKQLDTKVHSRQDIESLTTIPVVGELPRKHKNQVSSEVMVSETGRDRISEAFRVLRSNMNFLMSKQNGLACVVQLTSTLPGEGKTYVTLNLALAYAHTGNRVLVLDLDLRKGKLSSIISKANTAGLSSYLAGKTERTEDIIAKSTIHPFVDFIPTGPIPPNPANLLMSDRFGQLISTLKNQYDYIFMDTVPFAIVADATIVNRFADVTLYIMRAGIAKKQQLTELEKIYEENKLRNLSIIVTDVKVGKSDKYIYGYGYIEGEQ